MCFSREGLEKSTPGPTSMAKEESAVERCFELMYWGPLVEDFLEGGEGGARRDVDSEHLPFPAGGEASGGGAHADGDFAEEGMAVVL